MSASPSQARVIEIQDELANIVDRNDGLMQQVEKNNAKSLALIDELGRIATLTASKDAANA